MYNTSTRRHIIKFTLMWLIVYFMYCYYFQPKRKMMMIGCKALCLMLSLCVYFTGLVRHTHSTEATKQNGFPRAEWRRNSIPWFSSTSIPHTSQLCVMYEYKGEYTIYDIFLLFSTVYRIWISFPCRILANLFQATVRAPYAARAQDDLPFSQFLNSPYDSNVIFHILHACLFYHLPYVYIYTSSFMYINSHIKIWVTILMLYILALYVCFIFFFHSSNFQRHLKCIFARTIKKRTFCN